MRQAHLWEVGLTQIPTYHDNQTTVIDCRGYFNILSKNKIFKIDS